MSESWMPSWGRLVGRKAKATTWNGTRYRSVGWALGDVLLEMPRLNDRQVSDLLGVSIARVQYHRTRAGIPPAPQRDPASPYRTTKEWSGTSDQEE